MSSPQDDYAKSVRSSQEAVVGAVESWSKSVQDAFGRSGSNPQGGVEPNLVIDQVFDFAERMLEVQREFAKSLANAAASASETARRQSEAGTQAGTGTSAETGSADR